MVETRATNTYIFTDGPTRWSRVVGWLTRLLSSLAVHVERPTYPHSQNAIFLQQDYG